MKKITGKRLFAIAAVAAMMCTMLITTASAYKINDFVWMQSLPKSYEINLGKMTPGPNANTSGIKFYCVTTSSRDGNYDAVLQRKGFLGIWQNVGGKYVCGQTASLKYDARNGNYVNGQPNLLTWATNQSGEYRILLENPTAPQEARFSRIEAWDY